MVLGDIQTRDFHVQLQVRRVQRGAEQGEGQQQAFTHGQSLMNEEQRQQQRYHQPQAYQGQVLGRLPA